MILGVTMGDSSGVGPEILLKAVAGKQLKHPLVVYGDYEVLELANRELGFAVALRRVESPRICQDGAVPVIDHGLMKAADVRPGELSAASGRAARAYVVSATRAALAGEIAAMVTLPMNKEATQASDPGFTGHTELVAALCGVDSVTMMLASGSLMVTHVSTHCSLREAVDRVQRDRIARVIELTCQALARLKPGARVAVAGLNPHAGENGMFGREEIEEIRPAVEWARARGYAVEGPLPPDTLFHLAVRRNKYDAVVCMYHDQGHIPSKLLDFEGGVNITLGLPIIRTSVDHGTAFDVAWKGVAVATSFVNAVEFAARLCDLPFQTAA
jgi:4-hydroxythreonine-4-phosphate dehydrogenase